MNFAKCDPARLLNGAHLAANSELLTDARTSSDRVDTST